MKRMVLQVVDDFVYRCALYIPNHELHAQGFSDEALYQAIQQQHCGSRYLGELGQQRFIHNSKEADRINFNHASVMVSYAHYANVPVQLIAPGSNDFGTAMVLIGDVQPVGIFQKEIREEFDRQLQGCAASVKFIPRVAGSAGHISRIVAFDLVSMNECDALAA